MGVSAFLDPSHREAWTGHRGDKRPEKQVPAGMCVWAFVCVVLSKKEMSPWSILICSINTFVLYLMLHSMSTLSFSSVIHDKICFFYTFDGYFELCQKVGCIVHSVLTITLVAYCLASQMKYLVLLRVFRLSALSPVSPMWLLFFAV